MSNSNELDNLIDHHNLGAVVSPLVQLAHANAASSNIVEIVVKLAIAYGINAATARAEREFTRPIPLSEYHQIDRSFFRNLRNHGGGSD